MSDPFKARTLKRKNVKGLALNATPKPTANTPSEGDAQVPGAVGNAEGNRTDTLEIGLEFRLDLRSEDLVMLKELGAGNGGTVSKVKHASTNVVMARKVREFIYLNLGELLCLIWPLAADYPCRCQRERAQTNSTRTTSRPRLQLSEYRDFLRSLPE